MNRKEFNKLILSLKRGGWQVFGPLENGEGIEVGPINNPNLLILDERLPFFSFKRFFVPEKEKIFNYKNNKFIQVTDTGGKLAVIGINILDLRSILLYDQVFEKDPYYQQRRSNTLIIGHSNVPPIDDNIFEERYEEDVLEHLPFDIFLAIITPDKFEVFSGSERGKKILEDFGYKKYRHIQFSGPVREGGDKRMEEIRERMEKHYNPTLWEKLGDICLECGKCTIICPTCFCFRLDDQPDLEGERGQRLRCWDSCFYQEFSEIAGGPARNVSPASSASHSDAGWHSDAGGREFLDSTAKKIHFWYYHKFVRIPKEYSMLGCVGCGRCHVVCPVDINIRKILKEI